MAVRFAISSSGWSTGSTWDSFAQLGFPTAADDVWSNSYTVNVDTSISVLSLNNGQTPRVVENIATPAMTSNATPSGFVYGSTFNASFEPFRAFDQSTATSWQTSVANIGILTYEFPTSKNIKRYAIRTAGTVARTPRQWTLEGSNNNIVYTVLDTITASLAAGSVYTSAVLANTASFTFYRLNINAVTTVGNLVEVNEFEMTESTGSGAGNLSGGTFNFNTANVSASVGAGLTAGATNLITVTAATGTVNVSAPNANVTGVGAQAIAHTGACDFIITGSRFTGGNNTNVVCISKSSIGTTTIIGDIFGTLGGSITNAHGLNITGGNTIIIGRVYGSSIPTGNSGNTNYGINQSAGNLTIIGNVLGGTFNGGGIQSAGVNFSGTALTITGSVTGGTLLNSTAAAGLLLGTANTINISGSVVGATAVGISSATANTTTIIGNVNGSANAAGISYTGAATLTVRGTVTAGTVLPAIVSTSTSANNTIYGNLVNTNGIMAFYGPRLQISSGSLTTWRFTSSTGADRTLYTLNQIGDQPMVSNVRSGVSYAGGTLTGTMAVPPSGSVALGVPVGNTTGSAVLNPTYVADEIWNQPVSTLTASGSIGERIKNAATVATTGAQIVALTGGN